MNKVKMLTVWIVEKSIRDGSEFLVVFFVR